jgi:chromate transport protein ChrA
MTRPTTVELLTYFLYLGSLGFGGPVAFVGYMLALVPFLYGGVVQECGWLNDQ